jgi:hypothetical protein
MNGLVNWLQHVPLVCFRSSGWEHVVVVDHP